MACVLLSACPQYILLYAVKSVKNFSLLDLLKITRFHYLEYNN